jgi:hypothetical protein
VSHSGKTKGRECYTSRSPGRTGFGGIWMPYYIWISDYSGPGAISRSFHKNHHYATVCDSRGAKLIFSGRHRQGTLGAEPISYLLHASNMRRLLETPVMTAHSPASGGSLVSLPVFLCPTTCFPLLRVRHLATTDSRLSSI